MRFKRIRAGGNRRTLPVFLSVILMGGVVSGSFVPDQARPAAQPKAKAQTGSAPSPKAKPEDLALRFREFIDLTAYISRDTEKDVFLTLTNDRDRDLFIETFWKMLDPTPGTPANEYKDEIIKRFAEAARPSLIASMRKADLVICTGSQLEIGWLPMLLGKSNNAAVQPGKDGMFEASSFVRKLEIPERVDRSQGDIHVQGNPHIQLDPRNIPIAAAALARRLSELDPGHAALYGSRQQDFTARWEAARQRWEQQAAPLRSVGVITHHKDMVYLVEWLGMRELGNLEPKPGLEPSRSCRRRLRRNRVLRHALSGTSGLGRLGVRTEGGGCWPQVLRFQTGFARDHPNYQRHAVAEPQSRRGFRSPVGPRLG